MSLITKQWTPFQLKRLPKNGYWVCEYNSNIKNKSYYNIHVYCIMNGYIRYIRSDTNLPTWNTLLWSCMPTKNQIINHRKEETFTHFDTMDLFINKFKNTIHPNFFIKPNNDF